MTIITVYNKQLRKFKNKYKKQRVYKRVFSRQIYNNQTKQRKLKELLDQRKIVNKMYLRTVSQQRQQISNNESEDRALELSPTYSIDWDMELNLSSQQLNYSSQIGMNQASLIMRPQQMTPFLTFPQSLNLNQSEQSSSQEDASLDLNQSQQNIPHNHNHHHTWPHHPRNFLIISRNNHINEDDFLQAIDFLFKQINQVKSKPKFRHIINRIKTKCSICLNKIKRSQTICQTSCRHKFHKDCLQQWTQHNPSCPLCRTSFQ